MNEKSLRIRAVREKFRVVQHVRTSKKKIKLAKLGEQNFSTEMFRIAKVIERRPRPFYDLEDIYRTPIESQLYQDELTPVRANRGKVYTINKILDERVRSGILEYPVRWRVYSRDLDSWILSSSIKDVR